MRKITASLLVLCRPFQSFGLLVCLSLLLADAAWGQAATVAITSAASFEGRIAPESLAAIFGEQLSGVTLAAGDVDPNTPGIQLPTQLGGVSVEINGRLAGLLFVSPLQVNCYVPPDVAVGPAAVVVRTNSGARNGTVTVAQTAPGVFTYNGNGLGVVAGSALRIRNGVTTYELIADADGASFVTRPIDLGPESDQVFLVFYGTGWRRAADATRVLLGGSEFTAQFAGAQGEFLGLDQINLRIPRSLLGVGRISLTVATPGEAPSNTVEAEIGGATGGNAPLVNTFAPDITQAAQTVTISGSGFAGNAAGNLVRIGGVDAQVLAATPNQLTVRVPYGSASGKVLVRTSNGDGLSNATLKVRTSLSGLVESTDRQPLTNVTVRSLIGLRLISTTTAANGAFVLSEFLDPQSGTALVTIDGSRVPTTPAFGTLTVNQSYLSARDTQFGNPLTLQQISGASAQVGGGGLQSASLAPITLTQPVYQQVNDTTLKIGEVAFELPRDTTVRFPDGSTSGEITLTVVEEARLPVRYPSPFWASTVVQITPFGTAFGKGGRLRFPNPEKYAAGSRVVICQFDQGEKSPRLGFWGAPGNATVSADGSFIETDPGTIQQGSYYFVVARRKLTTVVGRAIDSDKTPLRHALARARGQETLTDGTGGFIIRNVPIGDDDALSAEAAFLRPSGRVDRANSNRALTVPNGFTNVGTIVFADPKINQPPVLVVASLLTVAAGKPSDFAFLAYDVEDARLARLSVTGAPFATIVNNADNPSAPILRLAPTANQLGEYELTIIAVDGQGAATVRSLLVRVVRTLNATSSPPQ